MSDIIFVVTNNIQYNIVSALLETLQHRRDNVHFIRYRINAWTADYEVWPFDIIRKPTYMYPYSADCNDCSPYIGKLKKVKHHVALVDKFTRSITESDDYLIALPHFKHPVFQLLTSADRCKGVYLIEEGEISYKSFRALLPGRSLLSYDGLVTVSRYIISGGRYILPNGFPVSQSDIITGVGVGSDVFPWLNMQKKTVLSPNKVFGDKECMNEYPADSILLLVSPLPCFDGISREKFMKSFEALVRLLARLQRHVIVSFHPNYGVGGDCYRVTYNTVMETLSSSDMYFSVAKEPVENIMPSVDGLEVVSLLSSVSRYAGVVGVPCYSWYDLLDDAAITDDVSRRIRTQRDAFQRPLDALTQVC